MPGLEDLLSPILGALGMGGSPSPVGGPPPPPNAGPQGAGGTPPPSASAAPAPTGFMAGLEHGLSNPLLQGAIASYLGTIGSPRREGWGRALAHGGLAGLGTFNQAEQQKSQLPLQAAQLAAEQAKTPELQAATKLSQARTEKLAGDPAANAAAADSLAVMAQNEVNPTKKSIYMMSIPGVRAGTVGMDKVMTLAMSGNLNDARVEAAKASAKKSEAETGLIPTKEKEINAHIGEMGTASSKNVAEAEHARSETAGGSGPKPSRVKIYNVTDPSKTKEVTVSGSGDYSPPSGWKLAGAGESAARPVTPEAMNSKAQAELSKFATIRGTPPYDIPGRGGARKQWHDDAVASLTSAGVDPTVAETKVTAAMGETPATTMDTSTNKVTPNAGAASKSGRPMVKDPASPSGWSYAE